MDNQLSGEFINESCPRCGATLLANKHGDKWCSNADGNHMSACHYGLGTMAQAVVYGSEKEKEAR